MTDMTRPPRPAHLRRTLTGALPALALGALLAGCGQSTETDSPTASTSPSSASPADANKLTADLTITVDDGEGGTTTHTLQCSPPGGDHPNVTAACVTLADPGFLEAVPSNAACTAQYGGPETATITGTLQGKPVDATLNRSNGCEISRWEDAATLLEAGG